MSAGAVNAVNPGADVIGTKQALMMNCAAGKGLQEVLKSNLGPKGTMKMLVSGAGLIKMTKDGAVLLSEMQIQHPTAAIIARTATAQDDITGDGTTSIVLFVGELLRQSERYLESVHPRVLVDGFELAREASLKHLETLKKEVKANEITRELLLDVARTSLSTKVAPDLAEHLTPIVVNAVQAIRQEGKPLDLHMVEIMHMRHKSAFDTQFINGLVLDHGTRHPDMAKRSENCYIMTLNVSLEYEKSTVASSFMYKNAEERAKLVAAERKVTDDKVMKLIAFKKALFEAEAKKEAPATSGSGSATSSSSGPSFIIINQKGIDPASLDLLQKAGIVAVRRAKRRNMERLTLACGGYPVNSVDDLSADALGRCKLVYEHVLGDEKYTFVEGAAKGSSCTILIKGPNDHTIAQIKDAIHDGLRAVTNLIEDKALIAGAGAFELSLHSYLMQFKSSVAGLAKLGVQAFADALLIIPKSLAANAFGQQEAQPVLIRLLEEVETARREGSSVALGLNLDSGTACEPAKIGIWDNYRVKKQFIHLGSLIAIKLLLVDEVIRAGRKMGKGA